ncbi:MAG: folate-binding protein YgfZ [Planctomycetes bacterium]|nr:folate-binding protein YgfZ [Planctomycetota bacterium]
MPNHPDEDFLAQYQSATSGCGFVQLENWTTISVQGKDRASFLHNMCTNEIHKLSTGEGCEAFFTDVNGKIVAHTFVMLREDEIVLLTVPNQAEQIVGHLERYVIREDIQLQDDSQQSAWLAILGPKANQAIAEVAATKVVELQRSWQSNPYAAGKVTGVVVRFDLVWPQGFLLRCPNDSVEQLTDSLGRSAANRIAEPVWTAIRIESGLPLFGVDFDSSNLPQEVDRNTQAINFNKGCYLGQETIARIDALGHVNKQIVGLQFTGKAIPSPGTKVAEGEKEVGTITSACWSPKFDAPFALAMVRRGSNELGKKLESNSGEATVVSFSQAVL